MVVKGLSLRITPKTAQLLQFGSLTAKIGFAYDRWIQSCDMVTCWGWYGSSVFGLTGLWMFLDSQNWSRGWGAKQLKKPFIQLTLHPHSSHLSISWLSLNFYANPPSSDNASALESFANRGWHLLDDNLIPSRALHVLVTHCSTGQEIRDASEEWEIKIRRQGEGERIAT